MAKGYAYYNLYRDPVTSLHVRVNFYTLKRMTKPYKDVLAEMVLVEEKIIESRFHYPIYPHTVSLTDFLKITKRTLEVKHPWRNQP